MLGERPSALGLVRGALALLSVGFSGCLGPEVWKFHGTNAGGFMRTIEQSKDPNARYVAYDKLGSPRIYDDDSQKERAAQLLSVKLKTGKEPTATRAVICRTLGNLRNPVARDVILAATSDDDALVRAEACRSLGRVGRPEDATALARIMILDTGSIESRVAAVESLGDLKSTDPRITELLVSGMEDREPVIRVACLKALRSITGKDFGVDALAWKKYYDSTKPGSKQPATAIPPTIIAPSEAPGTPPILPELPPEIP